MEFLVWVYTILAVVVVSLVSLLGVLFLSLRKEKLERILLYLVGFSVGGLLGDVFLHLLPQAIKQTGTDTRFFFFILIGILTFFLLEKFVRWRHCHNPISKNHLHPLAVMNLWGDGFHNLLDGMIIAASFLVDVKLGIATFLAVFLHEIPQEIGDFGVLLHAGLPVKKALLWNFVSSIAAFVGVFVSLLVGQYLGGYSLFMILFAAGGFIYIAGSDLIPELHHQNEINQACKQFLAITTGVALMALLLIWG